MTENEAIKAIQNDLEWHSKELKPAYKEVLKMAIQALEEIQQYRSIGTVEHIQLTFELCKGLDAMVKMYEAIGTIEEFKALKEKQIPKKPLIEYHCGLENRCPTCNCEVSDIEHRKWSCKCGQILDWE